MMNFGLNILIQIVAIKLLDNKCSRGEELYVFSSNIMLLISFGSSSNVPRFTWQMTKVRRSSETFISNKIITTILEHRQWVDRFTMTPFLHWYRFYRYLQLEWCHLLGHHHCQLVHRLVTHNAWTHPSAVAFVHWLHPNLLLQQMKWFCDSVKIPEVLLLKVIVMNTVRVCFFRHLNTEIREIDRLPFLSEIFPPDKAPNGNAPVGVRPFNCKTDSDSSLFPETKWYNK